VAAVSLSTKGMEHALMKVMEGCSDMPCVVVVVAGFALSVVCAVFVSVAGGEIKTHVFAP
jgi:hypothetical protein